MNEGIEWINVDEIIQRLDDEDDFAGTLYYTPDSYRGGKCTTTKHFNNIKDTYAN